jgi:hypothetical protein
MVASKARRNAWTRSEGTEGAVKKAVPISVAFITARKTWRSSSLRASSATVGTSGSSGCFLSANCTMMLMVFSGRQVGCATFTAVHDVEWPSTSPRSTASWASFDPL